MARIYNDITETIVDTPLVRLNRAAKKGARSIAPQFRFFNLPFSVKDRISAAMLDFDCLGGSVPA